MYFKTIFLLTIILFISSCSPLDDIFNQGEEAIEVTKEVDPAVIEKAKKELLNQIDNEVSKTKEIDPAILASVQQELLYEVTRGESK